MKSIEILKCFHSFFLKRQNYFIRAKRSPEYNFVCNILWVEQCIKHFTPWRAFVVEIIQQNIFLGNIFSPPRPTVKLTAKIVSHTIIRIFTWLIFELKSENAKDNNIIKFTTGFITFSTSPTFISSPVSTKLESKPKSYRLDLIEISVFA